MLNHGKPINLKSINGFNSLTVLLKQNSHKKQQNSDSDLWINPESTLILFEVGEVFQLQHLTATDIDDYVTTAYIPQCITEQSNEFTLQNACQKAVRKHLLDNDFHAHLFNRKDKLGLPDIFCLIVILKLKKPINLQNKPEPAHALTLICHH